MEFVTAQARERYDALVRVASRTVVGLDFDGTLSPIVPDPARARIHPEAQEVLTRLAPEVAAIAVITGRPARQALDLGVEEAGLAVAGAGTVLHLFGQYGHQHWCSTRRQVVSPPPPRGVADFRRELPRALREADAAEAYVEDKGLAIAVHTRRLPDGDAAFERLLPVLGALAGRHGLSVEPGRSVVEVRDPAMDKGLVVQGLVDDVGAGGFLFAGDDLGDVEAFDAVRALGESGLATLLVCSGSEEEDTLADLADVVVPGPGGVLDLLRQLTDDAVAARVG